MSQSVSSKDWTFRLKDIISSIDKIQQYINGIAINEFKSNLLVQDAVIRNLEIIDEAGKKIPLEFRKQHDTIPWEQMCGMRDILIHDYFGVDLDIVWYTVTKDLPALRQQLINLRNE